MRDIGVAEILLIVAGVLALIELFQAQGRSLVAWAVLIICVVLVLL